MVVGAAMLKTFTLRRGGLAAWRGDARALLGRK